MASSKRVSRLRTAAFGVLLVGAVTTFLVGTMFPAQVTVVGVAGKVTDYTKSSATGETAFNVLFGLLVLGPTVVASALLYGAAEIASSVKRGGRSRSLDRLEVGDEV